MASLPLTLPLPPLLTLTLTLALTLTLTLASWTEQPFMTAPIAAALMVAALHDEP